MGTTLHAILEIRSGPRRAWYEVGAWRFGKNHRLDITLSHLALKDWPDDSPALRFHAKLDQHRQWCDGDELAALRDTLREKIRGQPAEKEYGNLRADDLDLSGCYKALDPLIAACHALIAQDEEVRVLWYRL